ncbi:MAG: hypothetical protein HZA48_09715 [Planctomycetes bacterium]|nr:hypothetical protein [Planctomycetota bacterium]
MFFSSIGIGDALQAEVKAFEGQRAATDLYCRDYGGRTIAGVSIIRRGVVLTSHEIRIPIDTDIDSLPDLWEDTYRVIPAGVPGAGNVVFDKINPDSDGDGHNDNEYDLDPNPETLGAVVITRNPSPVGTLGDGLVAFEEYRGFFYGDNANTPVSHRHNRTSPIDKDLFIWASVMEGGVDMELGFIPNGPLSVHRINDDEWAGTQAKWINSNIYSIPGATLQKALRIIEGNAMGAYGLTRIGGVNTGANGICKTNSSPDDFQLIPINEGEPHSIAIYPGPNGIIDSIPRLNLANATISRSDPLVNAGVDDIFDAVRNVITTGPDGVCNTAVMVGSDDIQIIAIGQGMPYSWCIDADDHDLNVNEDPADLRVNSVVLPLPDDDRSDEVNNSPNQHNNIEVNVAIFTTQIWIGFVQQPAGNWVPDNIDLITNRPLLRDAIRKTIAHESGHGIHAEHYRIRLDVLGNIEVLIPIDVPPFSMSVVGFHNPNWSVMVSAVHNPAPSIYDATDIDQMKIHIKH